MKKQIVAAMIAALAVTGTAVAVSYPIVKSKKVLTERLVVGSTDSDPGVNNASIAGTLAVTGAITATGGVTGAIVGNADTATALAANGANCSAGLAPLGVSATGAAESCTDYITAAENAATATALAANGANCSASNAPLGVDASGAVESCTDFEEELTNSAGLLAALSDETGTGVAVFGTTPTIGTAILTAPTITLGNVNGAVPATQVIGAGGTIAADACGGVKRVSSASGVTTDTTNTFTAPAAANAGCVLNVCNENASDTVTLDFNANFQSAAAGDVVLGALDCVSVASSGGSGKWYQISALQNN